MSAKLRQDKLDELLKLGRTTNWGYNQIAKEVGCSRSTVQKYVKMVRE